MKIRNFFVLAITITAASLCAQGQASDGSMTFTDHLGQSISVSRYGTVLKFKDGKGRENVPDHVYTICPPDNQNCIESTHTPPDGTSVRLAVTFPKQGTMLNRNQTMVVIAKVKQAALTLLRRITWRAGTTLVNIEETVSVSDAAGYESTDLTRKTVALAVFEETGRGLEVRSVYKATPGPPGVSRSVDPCSDSKTKEAINKPVQRPPGVTSSAAAADEAAPNKPVQRPPGGTSSAAASDEAAPNKPVQRPPGGTSSVGESKQTSAKEPCEQWKIGPGKLALTRDLDLLYGEQVSAKMRLLLTSAPD